MQPEKKYGNLERGEGDHSQFLSTISHELRTPLTSISALSDVLSRNRLGHLDDREMRLVDLVKNNARRLSILIDHLFDYSKIEQGTFELESESFEVRQLLDELADSFEPMFDEQDQWLTLSMPEEEVWMEGDRSRLAQVVSNLITNASRYSPAGGAIRLELAVEDDLLLVEVTDQGIGISESDQDLLFAPFFRADNTDTRRVPGTGLGLSVAKSIAELHGGSISVSSVRGEGSCFRVQIPGVLDGPPETLQGQVSRAS